MRNLVAMEYEYNLHPAQQEVFKDPARFKIVVAGRRFGKTWLATTLCVHYATLDKNLRGYSLDNADIFYIAPTFAQAHETAWDLLIDKCGELVEKVHTVQGWIRLTNGRKIYVKSSDRPDTLRGRKASFVVLDELSLMKPETWSLVIRPMLVDLEADAFFIGTPKGKTGTLYDLYKKAGKDPEWRCWSFKSLDNPHLNAKEIDAAKKTMSKHAFKQEFEATFDIGGGTIFKPSWIKVRDPVPVGPSIMAIKLGSRAALAKNLLVSSATPTTIAIGRATSIGWHVVDIKRGDWSVKQTVDKIINLYREHRPMSIGVKTQELEIIEPFFKENAREKRIYPRFIPIEDYEVDQVDRITWALQGRLKQGLITFSRGPFLARLKEQCFDFPIQTAPSDILNAISYFDQLPKPYAGKGYTDHWAPLDTVAGY